MGGQPQTKNPLQIEPLLLVLNKWMEHGNTLKNGDLRRCSTKKQQRAQKKVHLGLQLDMASHCCLVADCGFCVATSALAPLASRGGKNWKSECRPDMIRMIGKSYISNSNVFFLTLEEQNRVTAQAKRKFSLLSHTPANRNECPCCKHFLTTPANTSILSLSLKNQNFKLVTLTRAPSQLVALFFYLSIYISYTSVYLYICLSICLSAYLPIYLSTSLPLYLSTYLPIYLFIYLSI